MDLDSRKEPAPPPGQIFGVRHLQAFLMFLCLTIAYALRVNLSVGIVAMVNKEKSNPDFEEFDWDDTTRGTILSSFFWGYVITQIPAGVLAHRFGPKALLVGALTVCSVFTLLTPVAASYGDWPWVCATRVIQGLGQGFVFPSIHTLLSNWSPKSEQGRLGTYVYAGAQMGTVISMPVSGVLATSGGGWPSIFYCFGALGILWAILWYFLGANSPSTHPFIRQDEKDYIESSLSDSRGHTGNEVSTPWVAIFTSLPMWSLIIAHCGQNWGFWTLLTEIPSYMDSVLKFDIKSNSLLSALPYLVMWMSSFVFSWISDFLQKKQVISLATSRKIFNSIGHWIPAITLIGLGYVTEDGTLAVGLLTLAVGVNSATYLGFQLNHIDLSPNHAGTMMGITNCAANIMSIIGPLMVGVIVNDNTSVDQWRIVFFIAAGIYFAGNLMFILFGKAEVQPWNDPDYRRKSSKSDTGDPGTLAGANPGICVTVDNTNDEGHKPISGVKETEIIITNKIYIH